MYADMGHFGATPIRLAWFTVVLPALFLNYLGQGALLLTEPAALDNPFYQLAPGWLHYPLVAFSTVATVIASQAIISGAYSLTQQSIQLGFFPRMDIRHTASEERGQIYVPMVNWALAVATLSAVVLFGTSDALAGAYGIAVSLLMAITTFLAALVAIQWGFSPALVVTVNGFFLAIDLVFFSANSLKLFEGGWFPLLIAAVLAFLMLTWRGGQQLVEKARSAMREREEAFLGKLSQHPPVRVPGTAAFFRSGTVGVPLPLTHHLRHINALHERVLLVAVQTLEIPRVESDRRVAIQELPAGMTGVILRFGFMESPLVAEGVRFAVEHAELRCGTPEAISYYIGRETIIPTARIPGMWVWREAVYAFMQRNAERSAAYFGIPAAQVVEIGIEIEI
jgi:KUP system potassium uptake protein